MSIKISKTDALAGNIVHLNEKQAKKNYEKNYVKEICEPISTSGKRIK